MTPCVVELVSTTDCPSLITTQELLFRSFSFAANHCQRSCQDTPAGSPLGMTMRDAVSARGTVQRVVLELVFHMLHG